MPVDGALFEVVSLTVPIYSALHHQEASEHGNYIASKRNKARRLVPAAIMKNTHSVWSSEVPLLLAALHWHLALRSAMH